MGLLFEAFILGLIGGATPGPILTGTFAEILNTNFLRGMRVVLLALIAETAGALIAIYVFSQLGLTKFVIQILSICGAVVLIWLASKIWKINRINSDTKKILTFPQIIILTALNSGYWIFWITVGIPKAFLLDNILGGGKFLFLLTNQAAWLLMTILLAFIFFKFRPFLERKNLVSTTFKVLALILVFLAVKTVVSAFLS